MVTDGGLRGAQYRHIPDAEILNFEFGENQYCRFSFRFWTSQSESGKVRIVALPSGVRNSGAAAFTGACDRRNITVTDLSSVRQTRTG